MTHGHRPELPDIFPSTEDEIVFIEDERHLYEVFEGDSGSALPKYEYTLNKAPVVEVVKVTGVSGGESKTFSKGSDYALNPLVSNRKDSFVFDKDELQYTLTTAPDQGTVTAKDENGNIFTEGTDFFIESVNGIENVINWSSGGSQPADQASFTATYDVTFEDSIIDWDQGGNTPDAGTYFYVTYRAISLISRYITSTDEELYSVEDQLDRIIESKFVDQASGVELDRIGETFGKIGKRQGRNDTQYRIYLKSVVQSFVSRGTKNGIRTAVSAATDVPIEDIQINEDFVNNEYEVQIVAATPMTGSLLEEVAEIADPSGVELSLTRFTIPDEETEIDDSVTFTQGVLAAQEEINIKEDFFISRNKTTNSENIEVDDSGNLKPKSATQNDEISTNDATTVSTALIQWNTNNWNDMSWATEHN